MCIHLPVYIYIHMLNELLELIDFDNRSVIIRVMYGYISYILPSNTYLLYNTYALEAHTAEGYRRLQGMQSNVDIKC